MRMPLRFSCGITPRLFVGIARILGQNTSVENMRMCCPGQNKMRGEGDKNERIAIVFFLESRETMQH